MILGCFTTEELQDTSVGKTVLIVGRSFVDLLKHSRMFLAADRHHECWHPDSDSCISSSGFDLEMALSRLPTCLFSSLCPA